MDAFHSTFEGGPVLPGIPWSGHKHQKKRTKVDSQWCSRPGVARGQHKFF